MGAFTTDLGDKFQIGVVGGKKINLLKFLLAEIWRKFRGWIDMVLVEPGGRICSWRMSTSLLTSVEKRSACLSFPFYLWVEEIKVKNLKLIVSVHCSFGNRQCFGTWGGGGGGVGGGGDGTSWLLN